MVDDVNTLHVLAASLLVAMVVALLGYSVISMFYHNPPIETPVDITSSVLFMDCTKATMSIGGLRYETLTSAYTRLGLGAKNVIDRTLTIDAVAPKSSTLTATRLSQPIVLPPKKYEYREVLTPWANQTAITRRIKPGDIYRVEGSSLTLLQSGPYFEYQSNIPVVDPPSDYSPPFKGSVKHQVQVSGTLISAFISQPGYAATQLLNNVPRNDLLVLAQVKLDTWVEETDVPFYIDFHLGSQALAYRASKTISFTTGGTIIQHTDEAYIGVHLLQSTSTLYLQDDTSPRTTAPPAATTNVNLVVGLAREKEATSFIGYYSYEYSYRGHLDILNYLNGYYEIWRDSNRVASGYAPIYSNINYLKVTSGQYSAPFIIVYNPTKGSADWVFNYETCWVDWRRRSWVCGVQRIYLQKLNEVKPIEADFLVFWEDLIGHGTSGDNWNDLVVRITVFTDKTARIAVIMGYAGYAVDFYITIKKVHPIEGDYVFTKPFNTVFDNYVNGYYWEIPDRIYYPSATIVPGHVASHVYYLGAFRSPVLTVYGLFPGDIVTLATRNRVVTYEVEGSSLSVNLLTVFGPRELIEALKNGGVAMIINPSTERILSLLPNEALIHVKGDWVDAWVPTTLLLSPRCTLSATGGSSTILLERRGDFVRVTVTDGGTGAAVRFGTFARVEATVSGFTMTIRYQNGATETISPGSTKDGVRISPTISAVIYSDKIMLIASDGVVEIRGYSSVTLSVSGSFTLRGAFGR